MSYRQKIFICATPYHVLLGNLICAQKLKEDNSTGDINNVLILTNTAQTSNVEKLVFKPLWNAIVKMPFPPLRKQLSKRAVELDSWCLRELPEDTGSQVDVFLACDTDWTHQAIVTLYKNRQINLFEDGIGSYTDDGKRDSYWRCFLRRLAYGVVLKKRYINCKGLGRMPATHYYSVQDGAFSHVKNIDSKGIRVSYDVEYVEYLRKGIPKELESGGKVSLIITQPMAEFNFVTFEQEIKAYTAIGKHLASLDVNLFVKAHPSESDKLHTLRCQAIERVLGRSVQRLLDKNPLEMYFISGVKLHSILGIMSTALASAKHFDAAKEVVSAFEYLDEDSKHTLIGYKEVLENAGCEFI